MWQTKYASAAPKSLGLGFDFRPCSKGDFLTRRSRTMIGNGKFEPFTVWNDIELRYRVTTSQWTS